jgi:NAD(P)-dependent dehydrogenase (short-subunit alcohol dehydrogenase family)
MNQVCVIVGVGPGMGLAVARRFGREGFQLGLIARRAEALNSYTAELQQAGIEAVGFSANAGLTETLKDVFEQIKTQLGPPAVMVYNVAAITPGVPSKLPIEGLLANFTVNVAGALVAAQQVIPDMRAQQHGTILFTGGGLALNPFPQAASLAVGKAGLRNLCYSLAAELEPEGIHVAIVTIAGMVKPGTHFDPDLIAEKYWHLHRQPAGQWEREIIYK